MFDTDPIMDARLSAMDDQLRQNEQRWPLRVVALPIAMASVAMWLGIAWVMHLLPLPTIWSVVLVIIAVEVLTFLALYGKPRLSG